MFIPTKGKPRPFYRISANLTLEKSEQRPQSFQRFVSDGDELSWFLKINRRGYGDGDRIKIHMEVFLNHGSLGP